MRLIDAATLKLHNFTSSPTGTPAYAILSHTWGPSEVGFRELRDLGVSVRAARERTMSKAGYYKIKKCCSQALEDGLKWVWVDTCCIDKRSSAELSEAINSMFQWYRNAVKCYAYLDDIDIYGPTRSGRRESISSDARLGAQIGIISEQELSKARWFTRGWTLQELIAPKRVIFYDRAWIRLGDKFTMKKKLSRITGIGESVLETGNLDTETICQRMTWASCRRTTRVEDIAYCLMGIFDVNMPLLYGEGEKAFVRLQEEIMKDSDDETLFAWNPPAAIEVSTPEDLSAFDSDEPLLHLCSVLARHPSAFAETGDVLASYREAHPFVSTNKGIRMEIRLLPFGDSHFLAILECGTLRNGDLPWEVRGIVIAPVIGDVYIRRPTKLVKITRLRGDEGFTRTVFLVKKDGRRMPATEESLHHYLDVGSPTSATPVDRLIGDVSLNTAEDAEGDSDETLLDD